MTPYECTQKEKLEYEILLLNKRKIEMEMYLIDQKYKKLTSENKSCEEKDKLQISVLKKEDELYKTLIDKLKDKAEDQPGLNELVLYMLLKDKKDKEK